MAGSLVKISETTVTSGSTVTLTGIDSTYNVYMLLFHNVIADADDKELNFRFTVSGTADSSANYEYAIHELRSDQDAVVRGATGQTHLDVNISGQGTSTGEACSGKILAFNFADAGAYSYVTMETNGFDFNTRLMGWDGGGVLKASSAADGFQFFWEDSANFAAGTFKLYGLNK